MSKSKRHRKLPRKKQQPVHAPQQQGRGGLSKFHIAAVLVLCLLGSIIYSNSLRGPFVFDDVRNLVENKAIKITKLNPHSLYNAAANSRAPRPVAYLSFALNYYVGELEVAGYHAVNLLIHLLNGILVYALAFHTYRFYFNQSHAFSVTTPTRTLGWMSLFAACLFIAHPLQTQAVVYVVQRMTSLATMFYLLALLLYIRGRLSQQSKIRWLWWGSCAASGLLALGSKQIAATLPIVLMLYEWFFFQDLSKDWLKKQTRFLLGTFVLCGLIAWVCLGSNPWNRIAEFYAVRDFTLVERLLTQCRVIVRYLSLIFLPFPSRLNLLHDVPVSHSLLNPLTTLTSGLTILGLISIGLYLAKRQRLVSFGILWFFIHLVIESSILPLELMYEHRVYLPMFGVALILPYTLVSLFSKHVYAVATIAVFTVLVMGWGTHVRNADWQKELPFWAEVISKNPYSARAHVERGKLLAREGKLQLAISDYDKAAELKPRFAIAYSNRGAAFGQLGNYSRSIADCTKAIELRPEYSPAYNNRGTAYNLLGQQNLALADYDRAIELTPYYADAYFNRGNIYYALENYDQAVADYKRTTEINPGYINAYNNRAMANQQLRNYSLAIDDLAYSLQLKSDNPQTLARLAWLLATSPQAEDRDANRATLLARQACEATAWGDLFSLESYAASCAENGKFTDAIKWQSQAIESAPSNKMPPMLARLELYLAKNPFRQPPKK